MGLLDRLLGRADQSRRRPAWNTQPEQPRPQQRRRTDDEVAIERYRYMLRTAPPEQVEEAHAEAFAKLTPQQRQQVLAELSAAVPASERVQSDDPRSLARMATRAEMRQPGTMERALGGGRGMGMGMGGMIAGGLLASVAGAFIGTAIADAMFDFNDSGESAEAADTGGDGGGDGGGDTGGAGGDYGGGYGDSGGFDGGDFGGDFGGGDLGGF
jgi:acyl transferase domain-containing protein